MATNISVITLNTSQDKVWEYLTKPKFVKLWQYGSDLRTTWEVGTEIRFHTVWKGEIFEQWGKVMALKKNELITYSLFAPQPGLEDQPENYFVMSYLLTAEKGLTRLEVKQEDNRPNAVQEEPQGEENPILHALKSLLEAV